MMEPSPEAGSIVRSIQGRDKDTAYVVLRVEIGQRGPECLVANGIERKLDAPKRKNPRHLRLIAEAKAFTQHAAAPTDAALREALRAYRTTR